MMACSKELFPALFIGHGGGPLPLLDDSDVFAIKLKQLTKSLPKKPSAIVLITAHWQSSHGFVVSSASTPSLLYDYSGFPPASYNLKYPAKGNPILAERIYSLFKDSGIPTSTDGKRGWDHGVFIPLMLMFPDADIPIVSVSICSSLDPELHIRAGNALAKLRESDILIIGSGMSFHNFGYFFTNDVKKQQEGIAASKVFDSFLTETLTSTSISPEQRVQKMIQWASAPSALQAHPLGQEEHLIPLHVAMGSGLGKAGKHLGTVQFRGFHSSFYQF